MLRRPEPLIIATSTDFTPNPDTRPINIRHASVVSAMIVGLFTQIQIGPSDVSCGVFDYLENTCLEVVLATACRIVFAASPGSCAWQCSYREREDSVQNNHLDNDECCAGAQLTPRHAETRKLGQHLATLGMSTMFCFQHCAALASWPILLRRTSNHPSSCPSTRTD